MAGIIRPRATPEAGEVALVIYKKLFENGPNRLSDSARYVAIQTITGGLREWARQLTEQANEDVKSIGEQLRRYKTEAQELRTRIAIMEKEK